eukprot:scaffold106_cov380-Prasinococcus_capsulatus_cf.AAC.50
MDAEVNLAPTSMVAPSAQTAQLQHVRSKSPVQAASRHDGASNNRQLPSSIHSSHSHRSSTQQQSSMPHSTPKPRHGHGGFELATERSPPGHEIGGSRENAVRLQQVIASKDAALLELKQANEIFEAKVRKLEQLLRLKVSMARVNFDNPLGSCKVCLKGRAIRACVPSGCKDSFTGTEVGRGWADEASRCFTLVVVATAHGNVSSGHSLDT